MPVHPDMFNKMANVEAFNDPQRNAFVNQLCKLLFNKDLSELGPMASTIAKVLGFVGLNSFGDMFGMGDRGQDFSLLHQSVAGMGGFGLVDQTGKAMTGEAQGPGAATLAATSRILGMVDSMTTTPQGYHDGTYAGKLSRGTVAGVVSQIMRERGGLQTGEVIVSKDIKPGKDGAKEAIRQMQEQGASADDPSLKAMAKSVAVAEEAEKLSNEAAKNADKVKAAYEKKKKAADDARELAKKGKLSKDDLAKIEKEEKELKQKSDTLNEVKQADEELKKANDRLKELQDKRERGEKVDIKEWDQANEERTRLMRRANEAHTKALKGRKIKKTNIEGVEVEESTITEQDVEAMNAMRKGDANMVSLHSDLQKEIKAQVRAVHQNIEGLSEIFGTEDFNQLQAIAKQCGMGSLTAKNNIEEVADRIRGARVIAEKTGRTVAEVFEEQAAIAAAFEQLTGIKAGGATIERLQNQKIMAQQAYDSGATRLTVDEQMGQQMRARAIAAEEHRDLMTGNYLTDELRDSQDEDTQEWVKERDKLYAEYKNATGEDKRRLESQINEMDRARFGYHLDDKKTQEEAAKKYIEEIQETEADSVMSEEDADTIVKHIDIAETRREMYEKAYGPNWKEQVKEEAGEINRALGTDYQTRQKVKKVAEAGRKEKDAALSKLPGLTDEQKDTIKQLDEENAALEEAMKAEGVTPEQIAQYKEQIAENKERIKEVKKATPAGAIRELEKETEVLYDALDKATTDEERSQIQSQIDENENRMREISPEYGKAMDKDKEQRKKLLEKRKEEWKRSGFSEEEIERYAKAYDKALRNYGSSNEATKDLMKTLDHSMESSNVVKQSADQKAREIQSKRDEFEKEIEQQGNKPVSDGFIKNLTKNLISGGKEIGNDTAIAEWMSKEENSGYSVDPETGEVKIDNDKINANKDTGIIAIKQNRTEEENKKLAANEKIRKQLGVETEEEALEILSDPNKLTDRLIKLKDSGQAYVTKAGEGENASYIIGENEFMEGLTKEQKESFEKKAEHAKYLKHTGFDNIDVDENGVKSITVGGKVITDQKKIDEYVVKQAAKNKDARDNLKALAENGDERAKKLLTQAENVGEMGLYNGDPNETVGKTVEDMHEWSMKPWRWGEEGTANPNKEWEDLDETQKEKYGSKSKYNLARAVYSNKVKAMRDLMGSEGGQKKLADAAKELGIDWDGKDLSKLKNVDMERIASVVGEKDKKFNEAYNNTDYVKQAKKMMDSGQIGADGTFKMKTNYGDEVKINAYDPEVMRSINEQAALDGGEQFDESKLQTQYLANSAKSLNLLASCVEGRHLAIGW